MKKIYTRLIAMIATLTLCFSAFGCGGKKDTGETCLDVFCLEAGYGVKWCEDLLEAFKQEDWVKEKYPGIKTSFMSNDQVSFVETKLKAGEKNNTFDLLFGTIAQTYVGTDVLAELTEDVYRKKIPGENLTYEEKCLESFNETNKYIDVNDSSSENRYFIAPWAGGMNGIFYNEEILESLGMEVPRTTKELVDACAEIMALKDNTEGKYDKGYSFIQHKGLGYLQFLLPIWWAQYQGIDGYKDYWNGVDDGGLSINIFKQKGRLYALKTFEDLFFYDYNDATGESKAYLTPSSSTYEFMTAQSMFLKGYGVFHVNGDWFENEMASMKEDIKNEEGIEYTIKLMRTPIISELGTKLGITEEELIKTVDYVDGKIIDKPVYAKTAEGYDQDGVIQAVRDARGVVNSIGPGHTGVVPSYAREADIAKDFLLFMATDKAQEIYIKATCGANLPFKYNVKEKNPAIYESMSAMQKDRHDYMNSKDINVYTLPNKEGYPLVRFGGLSEFTEYNYWSVFSKAENKKTAEDIYNKTIDDWNEKKWADALDKAGLR